MNRRIAHAMQIAALVLVLVAVPMAFAAKGGRGGGGTSGTSSIDLASPLVYDANSNGVSNFGDTVTFNVTTTATTQPYVNLRCYQSGVLVYNSWRGYFAGSLDSSWNFVLGSGGWTGGAADCTAWVDMYTKQGSVRQLASTSFPVGA